MTAWDEGAGDEGAGDEAVAGPAPRGADRYVAVIGPRTADPQLCRLAYEVGAEIARRGAVLLCGGLTGVMEAAARGAREASPPGRSIGCCRASTGAMPTRSWTTRWPPGWPRPGTGRWSPAPTR